MNITTFLKKIIIALLFFFIGNQGFAQVQANIQSQTKGSEFHQFYLGPGFGLDYGGIGAKFEYLPIKHFGVFGGLGYDLLSIGWNVGGTFKMLPDKNVSPNLMVMYGYNGTVTIKGASQYDMTSYGVTVGVNVDFKVGVKGHKMSIGLFYPFRSAKFKNNYDEIKNNTSITMKQDLLPIVFSIGFNFAL